MPITETPTNPATRLPRGQQNESVIATKNSSLTSYFRLLRNTKTSGRELGCVNPSGSRSSFTCSSPGSCSTGRHVLFHQPHVINPADALKNRKDLTYLDLPPDALKQVQPKHPDAISEKNRIAETKQPTSTRRRWSSLRRRARRERRPRPPPPPTQQPTAPELPESHSLRAAEACPTAAAEPAVASGGAPSCAEHELRRDVSRRSDPAGCP